MKIRSLLITLVTGFRIFFEDYPNSSSIDIHCKAVFVIASYSRGISAAIKMFPNCIFYIACYC